MSRANSIPLIRNYAGFPEGICGEAILARMRDQAERYGVVRHKGAVTRIVRDADGFRAMTAQGTVFAKTILLATGVVNRRPPKIDDQTHDRALGAGLLRYCPICDGYEVTDRNVAVLGTGAHGCAEAIFLRSYTADVTLVPPSGGHELTDEQRTELVEAGIFIADACEELTFHENHISLRSGTSPLTFDTLYPALGTEIRSELARQLGATISDDGCILVDSHQRTDVKGLYAAGDVVLGLDQISHAMGEGGVAATTIRNDLAQRSPLRR
jgi:thioredoxin reductase (NADPH)|tara:strand:+ start:17157 stop:17963 length:807 start_codon:yes stop_codon:yes gene_type:complete